MSWKKACPGADAAPRVVVELAGTKIITSGPDKDKEVLNQPQDPTGEGREIGACAVCDHRFWMKEPDTIPPHGVPDGTRPKGTEIRELDD